MLGIPGCLGVSALHHSIAEAAITTPAQLMSLANSWASTIGLPAKQVLWTKYGPFVIAPRRGRPNSKMLLQSLQHCMRKTPQYDPFTCRSAQSLRSRVSSTVSENTSHLISLTIFAKLGKLFSPRTGANGSTIFRGIF